MTAPACETSAEKAKRHRASALKGHRTRKRMKAARKEITANHRLVLSIRDRLLWPSSYRPSE
jgi:hypothetical protein